MEPARYRRIHRNETSAYRRKLSLLLCFNASRAETQRTVYRRDDSVSIWIAACIACETSELVPAWRLGADRTLARSGTRRNGLIVVALE